MFSMCSELTPRAHIPDNRIPQLMQPCLLNNRIRSFILSSSWSQRKPSNKITRHGNAKPICGENLILQSPFHHSFISTLKQISFIYKKTLLLRYSNSLDRLYHLRKLQCLVHCNKIPLSSGFMHNYKRIKYTYIKCKIVQVTTCCIVIKSSPAPSCITHSIAR